MLQCCACSRLVLKGSSHCPFCAQRSKGGVRGLLVLASVPFVLAACEDWGDGSDGGKEAVLTECSGPQGPWGYTDLVGRACVGDFSCPVGETLTPRGFCLDLATCENGEMVYHMAVCGSE